MSDPARTISEICTILSEFDPGRDDPLEALETIRRILATRQPERGPRTFFGVAGETLSVGPDEDGVMIRADFRGTKLSALGARDLAVYLTECAIRAEAWIAEASDLGEPEPEPEEYVPGPEVDGQGAATAHQW
jgi:hypothetical protein